MSKYNEDFADKAINNSKLKSLFDMDRPELQLTPEDLSKLPPEDDIEEDKPIDRRDPDTIIYDNIDRAERFLDRIEEAVIAGSGSARMMEVASQFINAITQASTSIVGSNQYDNEMLYKERVLQLKEREVAVKEAIGRGGEIGNRTTNNVLITTREDLLKIINNPGDEIQEVTEQ